MRLLLMRHGHAVERAPSDAQRALSERGIAQVRASCNSVVKALKTVDRIIVSPYLRAQQTADIAALYCKYAHREQSALITPSGSVLSVTQWLYEYSQSLQLESTVLLVTHNPFVTKLLHHLTGLPYGREFMDTASIASLECNVVASDCAKLTWIQHANE